MKQTLLPAMIFILLAPISSLSLANSQTGPLSSYIQLAQESSPSLESAAQAVKQQTGGRILSTKTSVKNGQKVYKIKILLPSGKIQTFSVSAQ